MSKKTYSRLFNLILIIGLLSVIALTVYTVIAYQNASVLNCIAEEIW